jgi:hypothetical protein
MFNRLNHYLQVNNIFISQHLRFRKSITTQKAICTVTIYLLHEINDSRKEVSSVTWPRHWIVSVIKLF